MTEHTPGPWRISDDGDGIDAASGWLVVLQLNDWTEEAYDEGSPEANARLIAAAPDLLAALESVVERYGLDGSPLEATVRAAIVKARGVEVAAS